MITKAGKRVSDHISEIRFKPNGKVLDHRGIWAEAVSEHMGLKHWRILENRVDVWDETEARKVFFGFRNCGTAFRDVPTLDYFVDQTGRFLRYLLGFDPIPKPLYVQRIGVRVRVLTEFSGKFEDLLQRYTERLLPVTPGAMEVFGARLADIGGNLNFADRSGNYDTGSGPMEAEQASKLFEREEDYEFPDVGLYVDWDCWTKPEKEIQPSDLLGTVQRFAQIADQKITALTTLLFRD